MLILINRLIVWLFAPVLLLISNTSVHALEEAVERSSWNMPVGVTPISQDVYGLHMAMFWWCVGIGVVVFGVLFYSMFVHRKSNGAKASNFHDSLGLEITWTVLPFVILIIMAVPATSSLVKLYDTSESDVDIVVTGYQWYWGYEYPDQEDLSFDAVMLTDDELQPGQPRLLAVDNDVVVPVNKIVKMLITADPLGVIHSWTIPAFGSKVDAVPGRMNETWFKATKTGIYYGQCSELCGRDHAFMPIAVRVVTQEEYDAWVAEQTAGLDKRDETRKLAQATDTRIPAQAAALDQ